MPSPPSFRWARLVQNLQVNLKRKVQSGQVPLWVAVTNPMLRNIPLRKVLTWVPPPSLGVKEIDWIVEKELGMFNPTCGQLTRRQVQILYSVLPPRAKYPVEKES